MRGVELNGLHGECVIRFQCDRVCARGTLGCTEDHRYVAMPRRALDHIAEVLREGAGAVGEQRLVTRIKLIGAAESIEEALGHDPETVAQPAE